MRTSGWHRWCPILLVLSALISYQNSFSGKFLFDDATNIKTNYAIRRLWPVWETVWGPPGSGVAGRPVVQLSFAIDYAIHGLDVMGYHVGNLAIHIATALALFGVVRRTLRLCLPDEESGQHATGVALVVALLWQAHPLLSDSVTYVSGRTELLAGLFILLTLYCSIRSTTSARHAIAWRCGSVAACLLGTGCKEIAAVAPILVLLYDWIFMREPRRPRWYYLALFATWVIIPLNLWMANFHRWALVTQDPIGPWDYLKTQSQVLVTYLKLAVWPHPLVIDYQGWPAHPSLLSVLPHASLILILLAATIYGLVRLRPWAFAGAWFFLILAPTSSVLPLPTEIATERRMYLPLMAIVALAVVGGYQLVRRIGMRYSPAALAIVALLAVVETLATRWRNEDYKDVLAMWLDVAARRPNNSRAFTNIGAEYLERRDYATAKQCFLRALEVNPRDFIAMNNLGNQAMRDGDDAQAESYFTSALRTKPDYASAYANLALLQLKQNRLAEAETNVREAVRLQPKRVDHLAKLAKVLAARGKLEEAKQVARRAAEIDPEFRRAATP